MLMIITREQREPLHQRTFDQSFCFADKTIVLTVDINVAVQNRAKFEIACHNTFAPDYETMRRTRRSI